MASKKTIKKSTMKDTQMTDQEVTAWIHSLLADHYWLNPDEYAQWATSMIGPYEELITKMGLQGLAIVACFPNDQFADYFEIRDAMKNRVQLPDPDYDVAQETERDPETGKDKLTTDCLRQYAQPVVDFFLKLNHLKRLKTAQKTVVVTSIKSLVEKEPVEKESA